MKDYLFRFIGIEASVLHSLKNVRIIGETVEKQKPIFDEMPKFYNATISSYSGFDNGTEVFKMFHRHLELAIINGCKYQLSFEESYFNSGKFFKEPKPLDILPGSASIIYVISGTGSALKGVSGGMDYKIKGLSKDSDMRLYIGFSNPRFGIYKTFVTIKQGKSAKWAYEQIKDGSYKKEEEGDLGVTASIRPAKRGVQRLFEFVILNLKVWK